MIMNVAKTFFKLFLILVCVSIIQFTCAEKNWTVYEISKSRANEVREKFGDLFWNHVETSDERIEHISSECSQKLRLVINNSDKQWTKQLKSSSGQFPDDFDLGTVGDFGNYDQCLQSNFAIETRYCMASFLPRDELLKNEQSISRKDSFYRTEFLPELSFYLKIGLCVPKACSPNDISTILDRALNHSQWIRADRSRCEEDNFQLKNFSLLEIVSIFFTMSLVSLVCWAGLQDIRRMMERPKKSNISVVYLCFSPSNNLVELFSGSDEPRWRRIELLRFLRAQISFGSHALIWPILTGPSLIGKLENFRELFRKLLLQPVINTFYLEGLNFTGGISTGITLLRATNRNTGFLAYLKMILLKFMSSLPILLATVFFEVTLSLFYKGPGSLTSSQSPSEACSSGGLLYHFLQIKGITGQDSLCAPHLWLVSTEFHLFVASCPLIYFYHRRPNSAKILMGISTISGLAYTISNFYRFNLSPNFFSYPFKMRDFYHFKSDHFQSTFNHLWMFVYAVLLVVLLSENFHRTLNKKKKKILTYISILVSIICSFSSVIYNVFEIEMGASATAVYIITLYSGLAITLGWTILSSDEGMRKLKSRVKTRKSSDASDLEEESSFNSAIIRKSKRKNYIPKSDWMLIFMKLSELAYFPSTMIILAFNSTASKPLDLLSIEQIWNSIVTYSCILASAPIFHILVTGPTKKLMHILEIGMISEHEAKSE
ncbi:uncharacterized protein LOC141849864 [Brevipalpus obovatus]|uniref:uncharacterized protein LOC141849864 n=1 Tax=Brevipalpus obovatus TaxID=246614 RepID=UPI003D9F99AF